MKRMGFSKISPVLKSQASKYNSNQLKRFKLTVKAPHVEKVKMNPNPIHSKVK